MKNETVAVVAWTATAALIVISIVIGITICSIANSKQSTLKVQAACVQSASVSCTVAIIGAYEAN